VESAIRWGSVPSEDEVKLAYAFIQTQILAPTLADVIAAMQERLIEARRGG
jgi:hypothetical protein